MPDSKELNEKTDTPQEQDQQISSGAEGREDAGVVGQVGQRPDGFYNLKQMSETQEVLLGFIKAVEKEKFCGSDAQAVSLGLQILRGLYAQGKTQMAAAMAAEVRAKNEKPN